MPSIKKKVSQLLYSLRQLSDKQRLLSCSVTSQTCGIALDVWYHDAGDGLLFSLSLLDFATSAAVLGDRGAQQVVLALAPDLRIPLGAVRRAAFDRRPALRNTLSKKELVWHLIVLACKDC